jgi:hypothetical protein
MPRSSMRTFQRRAASEPTTKSMVYAIGSASGIPQSRETTTPMAANGGIAAST